MQKTQNTGVKKVENTENLAVSSSHIKCRIFDFYHRDLRTGLGTVKSEYLFF